MDAVRQELDWLPKLRGKLDTAEERMLDAIEHQNNAVVSAIQRRKASKELLDAAKALICMSQKLQQD